MRPDPMLPNTDDHCRATYRLRVRAREAEAQTRAAKAETAAVRADMRALRADMRAEREALTQFIESPTWQRDLLILARDRVRAELVTLSTQRKSCGSCGGFGRGMYEGFLRADIDAVTTAHRLIPDHSVTPIDWPVRLGRHTHAGKALNDQWLNTAPTRRRGALSSDWSSPDW